MTSKEPGCVTHPLLMRDGSYISSSASSRRSQSGSPARSSFVQDTPIRDDLMQVLGSRGRSSGQFTNPQVSLFKIKLRNVHHQILSLNIDRTFVSQPLEYLPRIPITNPYRSLTSMADSATVLGCGVVKWANCKGPQESRLCQTVPTG